MKCQSCRNGVVVVKHVCAECYEEYDLGQRDRADKAVIEAVFEWARIGELFEFDNLLEAIENHPDYRKEK